MVPYHDDLTAPRARIQALEGEVRRLRECKSKGVACPDLPPEPPPPRLIPPPGGTGVQPPPPAPINPLLEAKLDHILAKLELLELRTHHLKEGVHVRMVGGRE